MSIYGFVSDYNGISTIVCAADTLNEFQDWLVSNTKGDFSWYKDSNVLDAFSYPDVFGDFPRSVRVFVHTTETQQQYFLSNAGVTVVTKSDAVGHCNNMEYSDEYQNQTLETVLGIDQEDQWDMRSEETKKKHEEQQQKREEHKKKLEEQKNIDNDEEKVYDIKESGNFTNKRIRVSEGGSVLGNAIYHGRNTDTKEVDYNVDTDDDYEFTPEDFARYFQGDGASSVPVSGSFGRKQNYIEYTCEPPEYIKNMTTQELRNYHAIEISDLIKDSDEYGFIINELKQYMDTFVRNWALIRDDIVFVGNEIDEKIVKTKMRYLEQLEEKKSEECAE